jgi:hypothetical protein
LNAIGGSSGIQGGGGRVLVEYGSGGFTDPNANSVNVSGGTSGRPGVNPGGAGVFTSQSFTPPPTSVPEPSSILLLGIGCFGLLGYSWRRRKQAA